MKNFKQFLPVIIGCFVAFNAFSQEYDDMYFNSKDRAKQNAVKISADLGLNRKTTGVESANTPINPTDSYSARNINPEYASQINTDSKPVIDDGYFIQDFQPTGINQNLSNCNCSSGSYYNPYNGNSAFNNPYYGYGNGFSSPFNNYYSPWGYPSYGGFGSGLSMSLGYGWGGYSPGYFGGMGYGFGSGYGSNFGSPYNPWGGGYYGSYYPRQIIVVNNGDVGGTRVSYAKRSSRSSSINHAADNSRPNYVGNVTNTGRSTVSSGRTRSTTPEYYDRSWKRNQDTNPTRGYWSNTNNGTNSSTNSNSFFDRSNSNTNGRQGSSGFSSPSRNSFNSGGFNSGGSRSGSSGSSSGSKTRGRSN